MGHFVAPFLVIISLILWTLDAAVVRTWSVGSSDSGRSASVN